MDLFTYLMAKKGHNTHRDLFSYLLGKNAGGSGTYTTFSGTSLNISNTLQAKIKNIALEGNTSQNGDPTPDTPIPIKVVTGEQNVKINGKNLFNSLNNWTKTIINNGIPTGDEGDANILKSGLNNVSFTKNKNGFSGVYSKLINLKANTTYMLSFQENFKVIGNPSNPYIYSNLSKFENGIWTKMLNIGQLSSGQTVQYNYTPTKDESVSLIIYTYYSTIYDEINVYDIQLEEGTTATTYEPYYTPQTYPISLSSKNLFDKDNARIIKMYIAQQSDYVATKTTLQNRSFIIPCKPNTTYTISKEIVTSEFRVATVNEYISEPTLTEEHYTCYNKVLNNNGTSITITTDSLSKYLVVNYANLNNETESTSLDKMMVEEGSIATSYEPYYNLELTKIGNYKDYIFKNVVGSKYYNADLEEDSWYKYRKINKWSPIGNENWTNEYGTNLFTTLRNPFFTNSFIVGYGISNYYKYNSAQSGLNNNLANGEFTIQKESKRAFFKNTLFNNATDFKNDLKNKYDSGNPVTIRFPLVTPTYDKITDTTLIQQLENINKARSYKGTTIIECSSASTDNEVIGFSGDIKVTSVGLGNSLNTSLLSSNLQEETNTDDIQEEPNLDDVNEIEDIEQNDEPIEEEVS